MSKEQEQDPNVEVINIPEYEQLFSEEIRLINFP